MLKTLEQIMNATYRICGYLASALTVGVFLSVLINVFDRIIGGYTPGTNEFAGYCVGAAGALGLAYAFGEGKHIRMTLLINYTQGKTRKSFDVLGLIIAAALSSIMSFYMVKMVIVSAIFEERSTGTDEMLLWIVQLPMAFGFVVFSLAIIHAFMRELFPTEPSND